MKYLIKLPILLLCASLVSGCGLYRMPDEDEVTVIPNTNNPHVIGNSGDMGMLPGVGY